LKFFSDRFQVRLTSANKVTIDTFVASQESVFDSRVDVQEARADSIDSVVQKVHGQESRVVEEKSAVDLFQKIVGHDEKTKIWQISEHSWRQSSDLIVGEGNVRQVGQSGERRWSKVLNSIVVQVQSFKASRSHPCVCSDAWKAVEFKVNDFKVVGEPEVWRNHSKVSGVQDFQSFRVGEDIEDVRGDSVDSRVGYTDETNVIICHVCHVITADADEVEGRAEIVLDVRENAGISFDVHDASYLVHTGHFKRTDLSVEAGD
jgi:hypothetical protein